MWTMAVVWLIVGLLLVAAEVLSGDFVLLMLGAGALSAAGVDALGAPIWLDAIVFCLVSVALITVARPALRRRMHASSGSRTNVDALVGGKAVVLETVDAHRGQVKLAGEVWTARSYDEHQVIEPGATVTVMEIAGATAMVWANP